MSPTKLIILYTVLCFAVFGLIAAFAPKQDKEPAKRLRKISLAEEIRAVEPGDTMVIVNKGDLEELEFYNGGPLKANEELLIVQDDH